MGSPGSPEPAPGRAVPDDAPRPDWGSRPGWGPPPPGDGHQPPGWGGVPYQPQPPAPKPGVVPLRPLGFGEILDGAFTTVQRYPKIILGLSTIVMAVVILVGNAIAFFGFPDLLTASEAELQQMSDARIVTMLVAFVGMGLIIWVGSTIVTGMITATVARGVLGAPATIGQVWQRVRPHVWRLLALTLGVGLVYTLGLAVAVTFVVVMFVADPIAGAIATLVTLPAGLFAVIFIGTRIVVATPALVLETRPLDPARPDGEHRPISIVASIRRSWSLIRGRTPRTFAIIFVANLIAGVVASLVQLAFTVIAILVGLVLFENATADTTAPFFILIVYGIGTVGSAVLQVAILSGVNALVYVDARMRAEGFDIVLNRATAATPANTPGIGVEAPAPW